LGLSGLCKRTGGLRPESEGVRSVRPTFAWRGGHGPGQLLLSERERTQHHVQKSQEVCAPEAGQRQSHLFPNLGEKQLEVPAMSFQTDQELFVIRRAICCSEEIGESWTVTVGHNE
jgi:hypothetical protein